MEPFKDPWINIKDKRPDIGQAVIVLLPDGSEENGYFIGEANFKYWQPKPEVHWLEIQVKPSLQGVIKF